MLEALNSSRRIAAPLGYVEFHEPFQDTRKLQAVKRHKHLDKFERELPTDDRCWSHIFRRAKSGEPGSEETLQG